MKTIATWVTKKDGRKGYNVTIGGNKYFYRVGEGYFESKVDALNAIHEAVKEHESTCPLPSIETKKVSIEHVSEVFAKLAPIIDRLALRWEHEHEYEDLDDYANVIKGKLPQGFNFVKMNHKPFGFTFDTGGDDIFNVCVTDGNINLNCRQK